MDEMEGPALEEPRNDDLEWVKDASAGSARSRASGSARSTSTSWKVAGIHVIAAADREPRHVVRDVESLLKARLDLDVYYKKIGVVQIIEPDEPAPAAAPPAAPAAVPEIAAAAPAPPEPAAPPPLRMPEIPKPHVVPAPAAARPAVLVEEAAAPRVECAGVGVMIAGASLTATVELARGGAVARIQEAGPNHPGTDQLRRAAPRSAPWPICWTSRRPEPGGPARDRDGRRRAADPGRGGPGRRPPQRALLRQLFAAPRTASGGRLRRPGRPEPAPTSRTSGKGGQGLRLTTERPLAGPAP